MSDEIIWLNGQIMPLEDARVSVEDRGFQFGDGVYEAMRLYGGRPFALKAHLDRLEQSARGLKLPMPIEHNELSRQIMLLLVQSKVRDGVLYLQLTRGPAPRNHIVPADPKPTLLFYARALSPVGPVEQSRGYKLWSVPDDRWRKCWIKSIGLTASTLARNEAAEHGADEAVFVDERGVVAECTSSNIFAVINQKLVTHPVGPRVLPGVTRSVILDCARSLDIPVDERELHIDEAKSADEVFISSTVREIAWAQFWDNRELRASRCGELTKKLHIAMRRRIAQDTAYEPYMRES